MRTGEREPKQGGEKGSRLLFLGILATIILLLAVFLALRPRGSQAGPPSQSTQSN
jgi:hypothetical protein